MMRFAILVGILSLILVGAFFAEGSNVNITCPSESMLQQKIAACQSVNYTVGYYVTDAGCKDVKCAPMPKTTACPDETLLQQKVAACQAYNNYGYEYYTSSFGCKDVRCVAPTYPGETGTSNPNSTSSGGASSTTTSGGAAPATTNPATDSGSTVSTTNCPSDSSLQEKATACKNANYAVEYYVDSATGCKSIKCTYTGTNTNPAPTTTGSTSNVSTSNCPSDSSLQEKAVLCQQANYAVEYYVDSATGCKSIKCTYTGTNTGAVPTTTGSSSNLTTSNCPSDSSLQEQISKCVAANYKYEIAYDSAGCKQIKCSYAGVNSPVSATTCISDDALQERIAKCVASGYGYEVYATSEGCKDARCTSTKTVEGKTVCPSDNSLQEKIAKCEQYNYSYEFYTTPAGCKSIWCKKPSSYTYQNKTIETKATTCTKKMEGSCIVIACTDGFLLNTCKLGDYCPVINAASTAPVSSSTTCPNDNSLKEKIAKCQIYNMSYEFYSTSAGCKDIKCTSTSIQNASPSSAQNKT